MDTNHNLRKLVDNAIYSHGKSNNKAFSEAVHYAFQPFYDMPFNESGPDMVDANAIFNEFITRIDQKEKEVPELEAPEFKASIMELFRVSMASIFNDNSIDDGLKFHLADASKQAMEELIYIKGGMDRFKNLTNDLEFIQKKKEEFGEDRKGKNLQEYWKILDNEIAETNRLLLPKNFILGLEEQLKKHQLIDEKDDLTAIFLKEPIDTKRKLNWKGSQQALLFLFHCFADGREYQNQSLYSFIALRFKVKGKSVLPIKLNNTHHNLMTRYLMNKNKPQLSKPLIQILDILQIVKSDYKKSTT